MDWYVDFRKVVSVMKTKGFFKVEFNTHLGGLVAGHLENLVLSYKIPGFRVIFPMECHPGSKGS